LRNPDVLNCYIPLKCIIATKCPTTELAHSKLNMVYLGQLIVVMTDRLKVVRIRTLNVPRKWTQAPRRRRVSRISLYSTREATVSRDQCAGASSC